MRLLFVYLNIHQKCQNCFLFVTYLINRFTYFTQLKFTYLKETGIESEKGNVQQLLFIFFYYYYLFILDIQRLWWKKFFFFS